MVFIYWGWDTTVSLNEETEDPRGAPGTAGVLSTVILLVTYLLVTMSVQSYAGIGSQGIGLGNPAHQNDVLSVLGTAIFGSSGLGTLMSRLLILMVLTSTAATAQTTILPNARTTLSMSFHKALPEAFGRVHPKYRSPTVSTVVFSVASVIFYVAINWASHGNVISDSVTSSTFFIAMYLGITGFSCAWHYRRQLTRSVRSMWNLGIMPLLSGLLLFGFLGWNVYLAVDPNYSYTTWSMPFFPHWDIGGVLLIGIVTAAAGLAIMLAMRVTAPPFFRGETMSEGVSITEDGLVVRFDEDREPG